MLLFSIWLLIRCNNRIDWLWSNYLECALMSETILFVLLLSLGLELTFEISNVFAVSFDWKICNCDKCLKWLGFVGRCSDFFRLCVLLLNRLSVNMSKCTFIRFINRFVAIGHLKLPAWSCCDPNRYTFFLFLKKNWSRCWRLKQVICWRLNHLLNCLLWWIFFVLCFAWIAASKHIWSNKNTYHKCI